MLDLNMFIVQNNTSATINRVTGNVSWTYAKDQLGMGVSLTKAVSQFQSPFASPINIVAGDKVLMYTGNKLLWEVIVVDNNQGLLTSEVKAYDYARYLNNGEVVIQFKNLDGATCITKLLSEIGFPVGNIAAIPTKITEIYNSNPADIIKDILDKAEKDQGKKYSMEFRDGGLYIEEPTMIEVKGLYQPAPNIDYIDVAKVPNVEGILTSIAEMRNSITVIDSDKKILATAMDKDSITKYGLLSKVIELEEGGSAQAQNQANNTLKELNKISQTANITFLGDPNIRANRYIMLNIPDRGLVGKYLINNAAHSWSGGAIYTVKCEVEYVG